jgi:hypothetical protein
MKLEFHPYKYYPYERQLALREVAALLGPGLKEVPNGVEVAATSKKAASRLVYFSQIHTGRVTTETIQSRLERAGSAVKNRQATRYSVHGLHEYKGKFNPQIAKAILNIFDVGSGDRVLDPFCGSGTTLVECSHMGVASVGVDINPLAVFIANAKLRALGTPADELQTIVSRIEKALRRLKRQHTHLALENERGKYLRSWFTEDVLVSIEAVRNCVERCAGEAAPVFLAIASNLLREFSLQDPQDLRIRRRTSPVPSTPFAIPFLEASRAFVSKVAETQIVFGHVLPMGTAQIGNITQVDTSLSLPLFDAALTSPPYAMALPYIDTQRLSLVWLGLIEADRILSLEAELIGSREMRGAARRELAARLCDNGRQIPSEQYEFCLSLQNRLGSNDGFRRKAVPSLLYRYFSDMQDAFKNARKKMKSKAPFALIVGHNHTVLGGVRQDIDTPRHLASLATSNGWHLEEMIGLQSYQRYGYHMSNAVTAETLILLRNK